MSSCKITVVMASYLGAYKKAAQNREEKILRAIESVRAQTFNDWELIVVSDGCERTKEIVLAHYKFQERIRGLYVSRTGLFAGRPRNAGIKAAEAPLICYLDIDDIFGANHLTSIWNAMQGSAVQNLDWYWFNDYVWRSGFIQRNCNINQLGHCGTSNIIHRKIALWEEKGSYAHDWVFIRRLKQASKKYAFITGGEYLVCHVPGKYDI